MTPEKIYAKAAWVVWVLIWPVALAFAGLCAILLTEIGDWPFDNFDLLWLICVVPIASLLYVWGLYRKRRALTRFTSAALAPLLGTRFISSRQVVRACLVMTAFVLLIAAIVGPRWGVYIEEEEAYGVDVVVALDVSRSMLARDLSPNRLTRAKEELRRQLTERNLFNRSNRLGLLVFAGATSMKVPLSLDHAFFRDTLDKVDIRSAPQGGTAIAEAIYAAAEFFASSPEKATKIILIVTDGEDHEGDPIAAAQTVYQEDGVRTFTVGAGDPTLAAGAEVPSDDTPKAKPLVYEGKIVFSKIDPQGLSRIAEVGEGRYTPLEHLSWVVEGIADMHRELLTTERRERTRPRYQWFLAACIALLCVEPFISERRRSTADLPTRTWQQEGES